jgi:hypothetical protein
MQLIYKFDLLFYPEDGDSRNFRKVGNILTAYTASNPRRQQSS